VPRENPMTDNPDAPTATAKADYRDTVFLPTTSFPMRGDLPKKEPGILARWKEMGLWERLRAAPAPKGPFILHDGPPYANGHLHIGHALNKILKDVVNRSRQMAGYDANYIPGWDCHGLPIEWKIEEEYRKAGRDKDAVPILQFRAECRAYAQKWLAVQSEEFRRLGIEGDWANRYATMDFASEAAIVGEIGRFLLNGALYRGLRPVMWSPVEKTALAEAEIEYHDHTSTTIWVRFPVLSSPAEEVVGASVVIWTTTPWTMPGNRAIACGAAFDYALVRVESVADGSLAREGERILVAMALLPQLLETAGITGHEVIRLYTGDELAGSVCAHPLRGRGYDHDVPLPAPGSYMSPRAMAKRILPSAAPTGWRYRRRWAMTAPSIHGCRCLPASMSTRPPSRSVLPCWRLAACWHGGPSATPIPIPGDPRRR
jgi:isoleucyl-tRNA synthetase